MTKKTENGSENLSIFVSDTIGTSDHIAAVASPITVVATSMTMKPLEIKYDPSTPSSEIVKRSIESSGMNLEQAEVEIITETLERSRNLFDRGIDVSFAIPGAFDFKFKIPSKSTTKTTKKVKYKTSKK